MNNLIKNSGLTPAVQMYEMDNNLNLLNTQQVEYDDEKTSQNQYLNEDEIDSNDEDNPVNDYPDESDEFDATYNTKEECNDDDK